MHVSLTPELDSYVHGKVASGRYNSASEVVREALRKMLEREEVIAELRREIQIGIDDVEAGRVTHYNSSEELYEAVTKRGRERLKAREKKGA